MAVLIKDLIMEESGQGMAEYSLMRSLWRWVVWEMH